MHIILEYMSKGIRDSAAKICRWLMEAYSLDDVWYYNLDSHTKEISHDINLPTQQVELTHDASNPRELDLKVGDIITCGGNNWNGYSTGKIMRTVRLDSTRRTKLWTQLKLLSFLCILT